RVGVSGAAYGGQARGWLLIGQRVSSYFDTMIRASTKRVGVSGAGQARGWLLIGQRVSSYFDTMIRMMRPTRQLGSGWG
ncbi:hypothetical protein B0H10DRAFT_2012451, partial [Mycena sp. CBHHK59/15]